MVDFPEPEGPTSAVTVPGSAEADSVQHRLVRLVGKFHIVKANFAADRAA